VTRRIVLIGILLILTQSCGRRTNVAAPAAPAVPPPAASEAEDKTLYRQGLEAFHQGTPEAYTRAAESFRKAAALKPETCEYALNLAQSLLFLSAEQAMNREPFEPRKAEAVAITDSMNSPCEAGFEPFILRLRAVARGQGPSAAEWMNRAVDLAPDDPMNWLVLGYVDPASSRLVSAAGTGRWIAASKALAVKEDSALFQYEFARNYYFVRGREEESKRAYEHAIELNPRHYRAYLGLANRVDEDTDIEPLLTKVVDLAPDFLDGRTALGDYYASIDQVEKAVGQYKAAIAANARYDVAHFSLGVLLLDNGRNDEAEKSFRAVIELDPASYESAYYLGNIAYSRKSFDEARGRYEQAVKVRQRYPEAEYGIGHTFRQQDDNDLALLHFDMAIEEAPRYGDAYLSRGDIRSERREWTAALSDYRKAIECYEEQIRKYDADITYAEAHPRSLVLQSDKKKKERIRARIQSVVIQARNVVAEIEKSLNKTP
jgi:tetratricopeptide (TPR) repeat protein